MPIRMLAVASLVVAAAACADDPNTDQDPSQSNDVENPVTQTSPPEGSPVSAEGLVLRPNTVRCLSEGPCSPACDQATVVDVHVDPGNCVVFDCSWNGTPDVGGCHP